MKAMTPSYMDQLFQALRLFIKEYVKGQGMSEKEGDEFLRRLQKEAILYPDEVLSELQHSAQRLWTSHLKMSNSECNRMI